MSLDSIHLRVPSTHQPPNSPAYKEFTGPAGTWLAGTWHVTHSSLPLWKDKRNVNITYVNLPGNKIQDTTAYTPDSSNKIKSLTGVNNPAPGIPSAFDWRGKGWLMIATSHWEILGWGDIEVKDPSGEDAPVEPVPATTTDGSGPKGDAWVVTYFSKTLFTPAGIDVYSRRKGGLPGEVVVRIKDKLANLEDPELKGLVESMFEIKQTAV